MSQNGNGIIRAAPGGGRFIEPIKPGGDHRCPLPQQWIRGVLWQCPEGHLWVVDDACGPCHRGQFNHGGIETIGLAWWPATWRQRRKYGPGMKRADLSMASAALREQNFPKPSPPKGPSPISSPRAPEDYDG